MAGGKILSVIWEYKAEIYRKKKTAILGNEFGSKNRKQRGSSFQLDNVQDGFWDSRPPARRGKTSLRLGERI